jgi:hypothetical protein
MVSAKDYRIWAGKKDRPAQSLTLTESERRSQLPRILIVNGNMGTLKNIGILFV